MKTTLLLLSVLLPFSCLGQIVYTADLNGPSESPPNASPGTGTATITYDPVAHTLDFDVSFSGLLATVTVAHIHAPTSVALTGTAGIAVDQGTLDSFPSGVTSGTYLNTYDLTLTTSYGTTFLANSGGTAAGAEAALAAALSAGKAYLNIHTVAFPGGEIRGFLVPEPASGGVLAASLLGLLAFRRRRADLAA